MFCSEVRFYSWGCSQKRKICKHRQSHRK